MNSIPMWTVVLTDDTALEIPGFPRYRDDGNWLEFLIKVDGVSHITAMFSSRHVMSVTSHTYVPEGER